MATTPNLVTVDLDDHAEAAADGLLAALDGSKTSATFFIPRAVAESNPALARRITGSGHEVGCLTKTQPAKAKPYCPSVIGELQATKLALEDATGQRVRGHRNSGFAVDHSSEWMYDVLVDHGFEYDSSRFPHRYTEPGYEPVPTTVHAVRRWSGTLLEVPVSTADIMSVRLQLGTTGSLRGLPLSVLGAVVELRQERGEPLVLHLRGSEIGARRMFAGARERRTFTRVSGIVQRFPFTSVANALPDLLRSAPIIES